MTISIQTLHDVLIALTATVGVAVVLAIVIIAAGALAERAKKGQHVAHEETPEAFHSDDVKHLILR